MRDEKDYVEYHIRTYLPVCDRDGMREYLRAQGWRPCPSTGCSGQLAWEHDVLCDIPSGAIGPGGEPEERQTIRMPEMCANSVAMAMHAMVERIGDPVPGSVYQRACVERDCLKQELEEMKEMLLSVLREKRNA